MTKDSKLQARVLTALVGAPVIIAAVILGEAPFLIMIVLLAVLCLNEFLVMARGDNKEAHQFDILAYIVSAVLIVSAYSMETHLLWEALAVKIIAAAGIAYFLLELFFEKVYFKGDPLKDSVRAIFYIGFFFPFFVLIREMSPLGLGYTAFLLFAVWTNDTLAYFVGLKFGQHRLNLRLSPKKSVEGAWGGFLGTVLFAYIFGKYLRFAIPQAMIIGAVISLMAQAGDLLESLFKRTSHKKDSSSILPGHGGFLDRMDSFILAGPVYYFLLIYFL